MPMRVLVYHIGSLGDTIVSLPALQVLRRHFRGAEFHMLHDVQPGDLVTPEQVLEGAGLVDSYLGYRFSPSRVRKVVEAVKLFCRIRRKRFDLVVSLLPAERPAGALRRDRLFFRLCGIPREAGFTPVPAGALRPRDAAGRPLEARHEARCRLERLRQAGISFRNDDLSPFIPIPENDRDMVRRWLEARRRHPERPLVAICPGSKKQTTAWPLNRFREVGERLLLAGCELVVPGGPADAGAASSLVACWGEGLPAAGRFRLQGTRALLSLCDLVIGPDTGTIHLAALAGARCLVVQSASSFPGRWDPSGVWHEIIRHETPCVGCQQLTCGVEGHPCMLGITVDEVVERATRVLALARPLGTDEAR